MGRRNNKNTKGTIISAAWQLFNDQGYDATTIEDIIEVAEISRGTFYHYFESKEAVISSMVFIMDDEYRTLCKEMPEELNTALSKLLYLDANICQFIENRLSVELVKQLFASQLTTQGQKGLNDHNRYFYRMLRQIIEDGQKSGELTKDITVNELVNAYAVFERGIFYDWCACDGQYNMTRYASEMMERFMKTFLA